MWCCSSFPAGFCWRVLHGDGLRLSPFSFTGRIVYGVCLGVITCIIRFYGNMAEGVSFALLLMNLLVPYINDLTRQKPLGGAKAK